MILFVCSDDRDVINVERGIFSLYKRTLVLAVYEMRVFMKWIFDRLNHLDWDWDWDWPVKKW